jgi:hypothetical protein
MDEKVRIDSFDDIKNQVRVIINLSAFESQTAISDSRGLDTLFPTRLPHLAKIMIVEVDALVGLTR